MKKLILTSVLGVLLTASATLMAQRQPDEYLGLPGDNLNLYAVMKLFQESETLETFERSLNDENNRINNLDLNGDSYVDYLKVVNYVDGNVHTIVLQAMLDRNESQDVAVFTVEKFSNGAVQIQLIGDELLYGRNYIVEPIYAETPNPGYLGTARGRNVTYVTTTYVEVAAWPIVRFIYHPGYVVWRSRWYWGYYPSYWRPWRPVYWHYYYGYHYYWHPHYYVHYRRWYEPRYIRYHDVYYTRYRVFAPVVNININAGKYQTTYSRPESRRDGEALFAKSHPEQYRRSAAVAGTITERRPVAQSTSVRQSTSTAADRRSASGTSAGQGTAADRRASATVNSRTSTGTSAGQSTATQRRAPATVNSRANTGTSAGQSTATERRAPATVNSRANTGTSAGQSTATVRRAPATVNNRAGTGTSARQSSSASRRSPASVSSGSSTRAQTSQRATSASRTTTRQATQATGSTARRSSAGTRAASSQKSNESAKSSESSSSSRRK
jgi:hypothetical protein